MVRDQELCATRLIVKFADKVTFQLDPVLQSGEEVEDIFGGPMCYGNVSPLGSDIYIKSEPESSRSEASFFLRFFLNKNL